MAKPSPPRAGSLLVIFLTVFIDLLGFAMVLPLLPIYARSFDVKTEGWELGLLMASFSIMQFLFAPLWGRLSDRVGRRPVLMVGLAASSLCYFLFGLASIWQSLAWLFAARIGAGIAGATLPTAQAYIADCTPLEQRARGMALIGAAFGLGFTLGPLLGYAALLTQHSGDALAASPGPGYAASALSAVSFLLAIFLLPESLRRDSQPAERHTWLDYRSWQDAWRTPSIPGLLLVAFVSLVAFGGFETTLSLLLKSERLGFHFAFEQVLLYFAFIGLVLSLAQGLIVRRLATRVPETTLVIAGSLILMLGTALMAWAGQGTSVAALMGATAVEVLGFSLVTPTLQALISRRSDPEKQGGILGVSQSTSALARITAPLLSIPLFDRSPALPYWTGLALMAAALAVFWTTARHGRDYSEKPA